jgi:hypothetical protein
MSQGLMSLPYFAPSGLVDRLGIVGQRDLVPIKRGSISGVHWPGVFGVAGVHLRHHADSGRDEHALQKARYQRRMVSAQQPPDRVAPAHQVKRGAVVLKGKCRGKVKA